MGEWAENQIAQQARAEVVELRGKLAAIQALCDAPAFEAGHQVRRYWVSVPELQAILQPNSNPALELEVTDRNWSRAPTAGELGLCNPPQLTAADYTEDELRG